MTTGADSAAPSTSAGNPASFSKIESSNAPAVVLSALALSSRSGTLSNEVSVIVDESEAFGVVVGEFAEEEDELDDEDEDESAWP